MARGSPETTTQAGGLAGLRGPAGALAAAWAATLVAILGVVVWLQTTYEPPAPTPPAVSQAEATATPSAIDRASPVPATADAEKPTPQQTALRLSPAPDPALIEQAEAGPLPVTASDGRQAWQVYARPLTGGWDLPRIALIVTGMGLNSTATATAIDRLPAEVTLAFSPYASGLPDWSQRARAAGHETLIMVPMEPLNYPANDPGPETLLTSLSEQDNLQRLHGVMARFTGYVGLVNHMGSRFTASADAVRPVMAELYARGVLFLDARSTQYSTAARIADEVGVPRAVNNRYIDNDADAAEIQKHLIELENVARTFGAAVGIGRPYPVTVDTITTWAAGLDAKGLILAPVTAVANRQPVR